MQDIDFSTLPGEEALLQPGKSDGAIKLIRKGEKGMFVFFFFFFLYHYYY